MTSLHERRERKKAALQRVLTDGALVLDPRGDRIQSAIHGLVLRHVQRGGALPDKRSLCRLFWKSVWGIFATWFKESELVKQILTVLLGLFILGVCIGLPYLAIKDIGLINLLLVVGGVILAIFTFCGFLRWWDLLWGFLFKNVPSLITVPYTYEVMYSDEARASLRKSFVGWLKWPGILGLPLAILAIVAYFVLWACYWALAPIFMIGYYIGEAFVDCGKALGKLAMYILDTRTFWVALAGTLAVAIVGSIPYTLYRMFTSTPEVERGWAGSSKTLEFISNIGIVFVAIGLVCLILAGIAILSEAVKNDKQSFFVQFTKRGVENITAGAKKVADLWLVIYFTYSVKKRGTVCPMTVMSDDILEADKANKTELVAA